MDGVFRLHVDPLIGNLAMSQVRTSRIIHRATWAHTWAPTARTVGILKGNGLHCLSHYFATLLIHNGVSVKTVQLALGHSAPMVTLNTYVGEWPEAQERTRSVVDFVLGGVHQKCTARVGER
jgi:integrase